MLNKVKLLVYLTHISKVIIQFNLFEGKIHLQFYNE